MIVETLLKGIIIGILVSAPMGPVGVLCIHRTLHKGRMAGLMTGIGATVSDLFYAGITYLGVGIVVSFIEKNNPLFTLIGSLLMLTFAFYLYRAKTRFDIEDCEDNAAATNYPRTIAGSFLITLSNPLIIFFYIALFTRFAIVPKEGSALFGYILALIGIGIGALAWWAVITYFVAKLREYITIIGLKWFNRSVALIFALVSLVGFINAILSALGTSKV